MPKRLTRHVLDAANALRERGVDTPVLDARLLVQHALGITYEQFITQPERVLDAQEEAQFYALLDRRLEREPMSHILGSQEFWSLSFSVSREVLTPRPDSETLIEVVLKWVHNYPVRHPSPITILDLGTGSGCLLLALLHALPESVGLGLDISPAALALAQKNATQLGLAERATFTRSRWLEKITGKYDIIVANPPYIASNAIAALMPEVAEYEPYLALDGGADGLACYRDIAEQLPPFMADQAVLALEIGEGQEQAIAGIFEQQGFRLEGTRSDLAGIVRCLLFTLHKDTE